MKKLIFVFIPCVIACLTLSLPQQSSGQGGSQYPIADMVAEKLIRHYQTSSCQELQQEKQQPPSARKEAAEQKVVQALHNDPQVRQHFLNKVAGPIVNKLFECGFIP